MDNIKMICKNCGCEIIKPIGQMIYICECNNQNFLNESFEYPVPKVQGRPLGAQRLKNDNKK